MSERSTSTGRRPLTAKRVNAMMATITKTLPVYLAFGELLPILRTVDFLDTGLPLEIMAKVLWASRCLKKGAAALSTVVLLMYAIEKRGSQEQVLDLENERKRIYDEYVRERRANPWLE
jgi:hypothetical protein